MTPDSTTDQLQNKTLWSSYTEMIHVKQGYPNTALVGVQVDSEQFGSQQVSRNYHLRGASCRCRRTITRRRGNTAVSGTERLTAYSNNMAWCLWDMLTHPRYGMGNVLVRRMWINGRCMSSASTATSQCLHVFWPRSRASPVMRT